jgi:hypothetical protein
MAAANVDLAGSSPVNLMASFKDDACDGLKTVDSSQGCGGSGGIAIGRLIRAIINILSIIVGVAAVIMVIISGLRYITSGGDAQSVTSAKNGLLYAIVGLIIAAFAQLMVRFVMTNVASCPYNAKISVNDKACKAPSGPPAGKSRRALD